MSKLDTYIAQACLGNEGKKFQYVGAWNAAFWMGCDLVQIIDRNNANFSCIIERCDKCTDKLAIFGSTNRIKLQI